MNEFNIVAISNRMSRLQTHIRNDAFDAEVKWCRTEHARHENWNKKNHSHSFYELYLVLDGFCSLLMENQFPMALEKGDILIMPPRQMHMLTATSDDFSRFNIGFAITLHEEHPDGLFMRSALDRIDIQRAYPSGGSIIGYVEEIMQSMQSRKQALSTLLGAYITLVLLEAARRIYPLYQEQSQYRVYETDACIEKAKIFIADNVSNGIDSKAVAGHVHLSERQLNRLLKTNLNISVAKLIEEAKINRLRELLAGGRTLREATEMAGFCNEYNMSRFFKRLEGMTPGQYRKSFVK